MEWRKIYRADGRIEWLCVHGCGHPDVRENQYKPEVWNKIKSYVGNHCCDYCCDEDDFPGKD